MRRHRLAAPAVAAALVAGLLAAPAQARRDVEIKVESHVVKTKHGDIYVEVARDPKAKPAPAIFTYSPYSVLGFPPNYRRNNDADDWVPAGYVRVWADVVGTGNSGGCWDYGGNREKETGAALVEWIAKQKWSNGKVGMIGGSYEGTTATATATQAPPHLTTIVPEAAISRWYGYAYSGGMRYFWNNEAIGHQGPGALTDEGFDTPLAFDFGLALPPPIDGGENWGDRVASTITPCDELEHTERGYDQTPDYDKFWLERDYVKDAHKIKIPVLVAHNWGDWNVKQEEGWNLFQALENSRKAVLYMGTRWEGHSVPGGNYAKDVRAWMDHWLQGRNTGADKWPSVITQTSDDRKALKFLKGTPRTKGVALIAQETIKTNPSDYQWQLLPHKPRALGLQEPTEATFPSVSINSETHSNHHSRTNHDWFWFESPPLRKDTRIFGTPRVQIYSTVDRKWVTFTPTLVDFFMGDHLMAGGQHVGPTDANELISVTRGFLDSRYRESLAKQKEIKPGKPFGMEVVLKPQDYVFRKGHQMALNISTEIIEWALPKPYPCETPDCVNVRINWEQGKTKLIVPIVDAPKNAMDLFDFGHHQH